MRANELREKYHEFFMRNNYLKVRESPMVNTTKDNKVFFYGSAFVPNMKFFTGSEIPPSNYLFTQQRVFWTRVAEDVTLNPVWSVFQVMMSFYQFKQNNINSSIEIVYKFLVEELKIPINNLYILLPNDEKITNAVKDTGFLQDNIVTWKNPPPFKVKGVLEGYYCKFFIRYKNGLLSIWDLACIKDPIEDKLINIDSCLLLERLTFILQNKNTWYDTEIFLPLIKDIEKGSVNVRNELSIFNIASNTRSIVCALADGAQISGKGQGHILKKMIRNLLFYKIEKGFDLRLHELVPSVLQCLMNVGYDWYDQKDCLVETLREEEEKFEKWFRDSEKYIDSQVKLYKQNRRESFSEEDFKQWKDSRGIFMKMSNQILEKKGISTNYKEEESLLQKNVHFSNGYSFNPKNTIHEPKLWLKQMENLIAQNIKNK